MGVCIKLTDFHSISLFYFLNLIGAILHYTLLFLYAGISAFPKWVQKSEKYELVVFDSELISAGEFSNSVENDTVKATYLSSYNPEFWEGYDIMEPNKAIREFTVSDK